MELKLKVQLIQMDALDFDVVEIERFLTSWLNNLGGDNWRRGEFRRREGRGFSSWSTSLFGDHQALGSQLEFWNQTASEKSW